MDRIHSPGLGKGRLFVTALLFGVAVLVLLGISGYGLFVQDKLVEARAEAHFFRDVSREINDLQSLALIVETSQRGYLIAGSNSSRQGYEEAAESRRTATQNLQETVKDKEVLSRMLADLTFLIGEREADLKEAVRIRQESDFAAVSDAVISDSARQLDLRIREHFIRLTDVVEAMQIDVEKEYQSHIDRLMLLMKLAAFTALGSGLVGLVFLLGHVRQQQRAILLEEEKRLAEKSDREKSKFLASMNHEIRTPLNAMLGFSELLASEVSTDRGRRFLDAIQTSGESLAELINDILDLSKIESGALDLDPEPTHIGEFAKALSLMFEEQASNQGLEFSCTVGEECPEVALLDGLRLRQILVNLIGNSLKFTEEGFIRIRILSQEHESGDPSHCQMRWEVEDSGRGIEPEKQKDIFQPFKQAEASDEEKGGTGLGLSICRELALLMGGDVELISETGSGSIFTVILPDVEICNGEVYQGEQKETAMNFDDLPPSKVLVVDDNAYNRDLIAGFLEGTAHEVFYAENGVEALEKMREILPDVVFMDIRMPVMTGDEAREKMLEDDQLAGIPVIAVTASSLMRQEKRLRKMFDGYLRKPFSGARLFEGMRDTLSRKKVEKENSKSLPSGQESECEAKKGKVIDPMALVAKLEEIRDQRWEDLTRAMVFSDVSTAADELRSLGEAHCASVLNEYAGEIQKYASAFDQERLGQLLSRFDHLIEEFKSLDSD